MSKINVLMFDKISVVLFAEFREDFVDTWHFPIFIISSGD